MNSRINQLVRTLMQKDSIEQCSLPQLTEYADRHPYFGAAQLLLAKKLQQEKDPSFEQQYQKTLLYFHNPLWVDHLLGDNGAAMIRHPEAAPEKESKPEKAETIPAEEPIVEQPLMNTAVTPEPVAAEPLAFEPFHTVDYFASQGIKVSQEVKPDDKFGKQLMSFTQWLKTMKRLPLTEAAGEVNPLAEKKVEEMAASSIKEREVVTEAMAEVWEKQGHPEKARAIYHKLSLLEPSKSAYFAAKIDALKN